MNKKALLIILLVVGLLAGGYFVFLRGGNRGGKQTSFTSKNSQQGGEVFERGREAPDLTLVDFDKNSHSLSNFEGKVVLLDYWAAWCPYCVNEMPILQEIDEEYQDVVVVGIHRTDTESEKIGLNFAEDIGVEYLLIADSDGSLYEAAGGFGMPVAVYIDKDGVVRNIKSGPKTKQDIEGELELLL